MWIPEWLYERLPHVYIAVALGCLVVFSLSSAAVLSASLLCSAALLTHLRRRQARKPLPPGRTHPSR